VRYVGPGSPNALLADSLNSIANVVEPLRARPARRSSRGSKSWKPWRVGESDRGRLIWRCRPPTLRLVAPVDGKEFQLAQRPAALIYAPSKHFCLLGRPGIASFPASPDSVTPQAGSLRLP